MTIYYTLEWAFIGGDSNNPEHGTEHFKTKGERKEHWEFIKQEYSPEFLEWDMYESKKCKCCGVISHSKESGQE